MQVDAGLTPIDATGQVHGDSALLVAVRTSRDAGDTHRVRLTGRPPADARPAGGGARRTAEEGARVTMPVFDPITLAPREMQVSIEAESVFVVQDSSVFDAQRSRWTGARPDTVRAWRFATDTSEVGVGLPRLGGRAGAVGAGDARLLGMTLERRPYEVAFENWKADARSAAQSRLIATSTRRRPIAANRPCAQVLDTLRDPAERSGRSTVSTSRGIGRRCAGDTLTISREEPRRSCGVRAANGAKEAVVSTRLSRRRAADRVECARRSCSSRAALRGTDTEPRSSPIASTDGCTTR